MRSKKKLILRTGIFIGVFFILVGVISMIIVLKPSSLSQSKHSKKTISGNSIKDISNEVIQTYKLAPSYAKKMLLIMWGIFLIVIIGIFVRDKIIAQRHETKIRINPVYGEFETDLDVLYKILSEKKALKIRTIAEAFKVSQEKAMEWSKILEAGNLATIEYPGMFRSPELVIIKRGEIKEDEKAKT